MKVVRCFGWVLVHYHNTSQIVRFVRHLRTQSLPAAWKLEIVVVDNSTNLSCSEQELGAWIARPKNNLGYLNGGAYGTEVLRERCGRRPAWTAVSNADLVLGDGFLNTLLLRKLPDAVGIVAPDIRTKRGRRQNPFMRKRPRFLYMYVRKAVFTNSWLMALYWWLNKAKNRLKAHDLPLGIVKQEEDIPIYAPHGSAFIVRDSFFERGGTLRYDAFLYGEEVHLAEQARTAGVNVVWMPSLRVWHHRKSTVDQIEPEQRRKWHLESARFLCKTYFHRGRTRGNNT